MPVIRDANTLIGFLDRGELVRDTMQNLTDMLVVLKEYSDGCRAEGEVQGQGHPRDRGLVVRTAWSRSSARSA
jgi:hypothetical protein